MRTDDNTTTIIVSHAYAQVERLMSPGDLRAQVAGLVIHRPRLGKKTSPSSVKEWRNDLGFKKGPFTEIHAILLAFHGDLLALGTSRADAIAKTRQLFQEIKVIIENIEESHER